MYFSLRAVCAGHYCSGGAEEAAPVGRGYGGVCDRGHYCPNGTATPQPCPPGSFSDAEGLKAADDCLLCSPGKLIIIIIMAEMAVFLHMAGYLIDGRRRWPVIECFHTRTIL